MSKACSSKVIFFLSCLVFLFGYAFTLGQRPIIIDDNLLAVMEKHPNFVLDIREGKKIYPKTAVSADPLPSGIYRAEVPPVLEVQVGQTRLPLLFENRQGGLAQLFFRTFFLPWGMQWATMLWHVFFNLTCLFFFVQIFSYFAGPMAAALAGLFLAADAAFIASYSYALTEAFLHLWLLSAFWALVLWRKAGHRAAWWWATFAIAISIFIKITYLWYLPFFLIVFRREFFCRRGISLWAAMIFFALAYVACIEFPELFKELQDSYHPFLAHNPLRELWNMIADKKNFLAYLTDPDFLFNGRIFFSYLNFSWMGLLNIMLFLSPLLLWRRIEKRRVLSTIYLGFALWFLAMWACLPKSLKYMEYMFPLTFYPAAVFGLIVSQLFSRISRTSIRYGVLLILLAPQAFLTWDWGRVYRHLGPVSFINLRLQQKITEDLLNDGVTKPYTVNIMDAARFELLSGQRLLPDHLWYFLWKKKFPRLPDLLSELKEGTMLLTMDWNHRWMMPGWGEASVDTLKLEARKKGILIEGEKIYSTSGIERIYRFNFKNQNLVD